MTIREEVNGRFSPSSRFGVMLCWSLPLTLNPRLRRFRISPIEFHEFNRRHAKSTSQRLANAKLRFSFGFSRSGTKICQWTRLACAAAITRPRPGETDQAQAQVIPFREFAQRTNCPLVGETRALFAAKQAAARTAGAHLFLGERLSPLKWAGLVVGVSHASRSFRVALRAGTAA